MPKRKIPGVTVSSSNSKPKVLGSDETLDPSKTIDASSSDDNQEEIAPVETVPTTETVSANRLESETTASSEAKKPEPVEHASRPEHTVGQHPLKTRFFKEINLSKPLVILTGMVIVVTGIWIISANRFPAESVGPVESGDPGEILEADTIIQPVSSDGITSDAGLVQPPDNMAPDEANLVNNAATSVAILELSKSLRGSQPFDRQLQTVTAVVNRVGGLPQVKILLEFVEMYALQGVPGTLQLSELIPALRLEVEVFSGLESRSFLGELFYSALALASDDAKLELQRADKTRAIFVVAKNQLSEGSIEGAIVALSHLEPTQKEVALSFIEMLKGRLALDRTAKRLEDIALNILIETN
ncbi:hypothetical protein OAT46_06980 [Gammaproteobacteria bacterium]|nr:hypothetical protein [Gammaproteobacteria bacterium]